MARLGQETKISNLHRLLDATYICRVISGFMTTLTDKTIPRCYPRPFGARLRKLWLEDEESPNFSLRTRYVCGCCCLVFGIHA